MGSWPSRPRRRRAVPRAARRTTSGGTRWADRPGPRSPPRRTRPSGGTATRQRSRRHPGVEQRRAGDADEDHAQRPAGRDGDCAAPEDGAPASGSRSVTRTPAAHGRSVRPRPRSARALPGARARSAASRRAMARAARRMPKAPRARQGARRADAPRSHSARQDDGVAAIPARPEHEHLSATPVGDAPRRHREGHGPEPVALAHGGRAHQAGAGAPRPTHRGAVRRRRVARARTTSLRGPSWRHRGPSQSGASRRATRGSAARARAPARPAGVPRASVSTTTTAATSPRGAPACDGACAKRAARMRSTMSPFGLDRACHHAASASPAATSCSGLGERALPARRRDRPWRTPAHAGPR